MSAWGWPQWTMAVLIILSFAMKLSLHGQPREPHNAGYGFLDAVIVTGLLYAGGFWS